MNWGLFLVLYQFLVLLASKCFILRCKFTKFDLAPSVLRHVTLQRPEPAGHIYSAHMHISQATVSVLHLLQGPPAPRPSAQVQQNNSE